MSYQSATPVAFNHPAVIPRISTAGDELWLGIPIQMVPYEPGSAAATVSMYGRNRRVHSWTNPSANQQGSGWEQFKQRYIRTVNDFWDDHLLLVPSSSIATQQGASTSQYPDVRCRYHAYLVDSNPRLRALVTLTMTRDSSAWLPNLRTGSQTSRCSFLGRTFTTGAAAGYHALLDSNDTRSRPITGGPPGTEGTQQVAACHEMGHFLGLFHRCTNIAPGGALHQRWGGTIHPNAANDRLASRTAYCDAISSNATVAAFQDVMASGMDLNPWHAGLWQSIIPNVRVGALDYAATTWTPQAPQRP